MINMRGQKPILISNLSEFQITVEVNKENNK
jgi:hypothetical protein